MKTAGPAAMMAVLLPTKRPAPMMPPIEIIAKCRLCSERLSCREDPDSGEMLCSVISGPLGLVAV
jgi:hypothetical protein